MGKHRGGRWGCRWGRGGVGGTPLHGAWLRCGVGRHGMNRRDERGMCMWPQVGHGLREGRTRLPFRVIDRAMCMHERIAWAENR